MKSSFNVIKNNNVRLKENKVIDTLYFNLESPEKDGEKKVELNIKEAERLRNQKETFEKLREEIIKNAEIEKEKIIENAYECAGEIEREAYEKGFSEGLQNGHEDGYKEAYEENIKKAEEEILNAKTQAQEFLMNAQEEYEKYLTDNRNNIISLAMKMAKKLTKKELIEADGLNELIEEALEDAKRCKSVVIRCNKKHKDVIENNIEVWKSKFSIGDKFFVIVDNSLEEGNAIIEKENGISKIGIDVGLEKLKEALR